MSTKVLLPRIIRQGDLNDICRRRISAVKRWGKFLWFELDGSMRLFFHMRMSGTLILSKAGAEYSLHVRAVIGFAEDELLYHDPRTLGGIWVSADGTPPWRKLGVDPLDDRFTREMLWDLVTTKRTAIKLVLMNQELIAGLGNIYASETLFMAGIDPRRRASDLTRIEVDKLHFAIMDILKRAVAMRGTTFRDFKLTDGHDGGFQQFLKVYGKKNEPCAICGNQIKRIVQSQRSTFFCPFCQH